MKIPRIDIGKELLSKVLRLALCLAAVMTVYVLILKYRLTAAYVGLYVVTGLVCCAVAVLTRGFSKKKLGEDDLPPGLCREEIEERLASAEKKRDIGVKLGYLLIPLAAVIMFDIVWVCFFS